LFSDGVGVKKKTKLLFPVVVIRQKRGKQLVFMRKYYYVGIRDN